MTESTSSFSSETITAISTRQATNITSTVHTVNVNMPTTKLLTEPFAPQLSVRATSTSATASEHLILPINLSYGSVSESTFSLYDTGSQVNLIDEEYARALRLPIFERETPILVEGFDGTTSNTSITRHTAPVHLQIGNHVELIELNLSKIGHYPVILGTPWSRIHDPLISFSENKVTFSSVFCAHNCLPYDNSTQILPHHPVEAVYGQGGMPHSYPLDLLKSTSKLLSSSTSRPATIAASSYHPGQDPLARVGLERPNGSPPSSLKISIISETAFRREAREASTIYAILYAEIPDRFNVSTASTMAGVGAAPSKEDGELPPQYQDFQDVFSKTSADALPPHAPWDHTIEIESGKSIPTSKIYPLSASELEVLSTYLDENLKSGFVRPSSSPVGAPILFVKKKDGSLRLCVDYRNLNSVTIKNKYPLPLINETLDRLCGAKFFTKIDIRNAYHRIRIAEGQEWMTAFRTRYGHFEYQVMPFGLTNAPATFQALINDTFRPYLDIFVVAYLDDILVYSETEKEHINHVRLVLQKMRERHLFAKASKCEFHADQVDYLGYIINREGVSMDPSKIDSIQDWPVPESVKQVQSFLGFTNFYRRFIKDYSKLTTPLTRFTRKGEPFIWDHAAAEAFKTLKSSFAPGLILRHYDPLLLTELETDASDFAIGAVISQRHEKRLHPIAFYSRKLNPAELNYEIYDKELLSIVEACKHWRPYLEHAQEPFKIWSDHFNLQYFFSSRTLNRRQARWFPKL